MFRRILFGVLGFGVAAFQHADEMPEHQDGDEAAERVRERRGQDDAEDPVDQGAGSAAALLSPPALQLDFLLLRRHLADCFFIFIH